MNTAARLALVAGALTFAIWLAPASVQIVSWPPGGPARVAYVWPLARLWIASAVAIIAVAAVVGLARRGGRQLREATSALSPLVLLLLWVVPFLPWLPDRVPLLMILAGPLRWVVATFAVVAAVGRMIQLVRPVRLSSIHLNAFGVFAISAIVYAACGLQYADRVGFAGDEPHYLVLAHSLIADRDLDIANNHAQRDYRPFYGGELRPDYLRRGRGGEIYSVHAPGLAMLVAPAYALAGATATIIVVAVIAALAAWMIYRVARLLAGSGVATVVWAATALTVPFVPHAWLLYPEAAAACIVSFAILRMYEPPKSPAAVLTYGLVLSCLPWFHTKFVVLLAPLVLFEVVRQRRQAAQLFAFLIPIAIVDAVWLYSFYRMYGELSPEAPYGGFAQTFVRWRHVPRGIVGLLFDQKFGLWVYSPVYLVAVPGAWIMLRDRGQRVVAMWLIAIALCCVAGSTRFYMWWGGSSAPARFLVPIVPLLAPMITTAVVAARNNNAGRAAVALTLAASLGFSASAALSRDHKFFFSSPHGRSEFVRAIQGSAPLDAALPTYTEEDWPAPLRNLLPWLAGLALGLGAAAGLARTRGTAFVIGSTASIVFFFTASVLARSYSTADRTDAAIRGQLALLDAYDPSRFHAVDVTRAARLADSEVLAQLAITVIRSGHGARPDESLERPFELPAGRFEARLWLEGNQPPSTEAVVSLARQVVLIRRSANEQSPIPLAFQLPLGAPVFVGISNPLAARALRRVDLVPVDIGPRSIRPAAAASRFDTAAGSAGGFIAYLDDHTFPEGGVFWTRGTKEGSVWLSAERAATLRLIVHVGPNGGPITIRSSDRRIDVDMKADETRDIEWPIQPGAVNLVLSVKAARSFRPAEVDPKSDDYRELGCQVRPHLE